MKLITLFFLLAISTLGSCQKAEPEIFLIPENFTGKVQIIYNQNGIPIKYKNEYGKDTIYTPKIGKPIKYEKNARVYEIPENGILLTQFPNNDGIINQKYFIVNKNGERKFIEVIDKQDYQKSNIDKNKIGIFGYAVSGVYGNQNIPYQEFIVSTYNEVDNFYTQKYEDALYEKVRKEIGVDY